MAPSRASLTSLSDAPEAQYGAARSFEEVLAELGDIYNYKLANLRQEYEQRLHEMSRQNDVLRRRLTEVGMSLDDVMVEREQHATISRGHTTAVKMGAGSDLFPPASSGAACGMPANAAVGAAAEAGASPSAEQATKPAVAAAVAPGALRATAASRAAKPPAGNSGQGSANEVIVDRPGGTLRSLCESLNHIMFVAGEFKIRDDWTKTINYGSLQKNMDALMTRYGCNEHGQNLKSIPGDVVAKVAIVSDNQEAIVGTGCTIYPNSSWRQAWDLSGLALIGWDVITIPFLQAFDPQTSWFTIGMDWITMLFWTADMMQGFFLGYFENGQYISDNKRVLKHYLMTWFIPDMIVVGQEWIMTVASSTLVNSDTDSYGELGKILKGARAIRILRLLRLLKLQRIVNLLYDLVESEHTFIFVSLVRLLVAVLLLNHVIACCWFAIGMYSSSRGLTNWIEVGNVQNTDIWYQYTTSMHWSLTQFTPASMDISARNFVERLFSIVVLFFAMVAFSSIVASITGSITSLRNLRAEDMKQFWLLRRYLRQRNVKGDLSDRICKYLEHEIQKQNKLLQRKSIRVLQHLSVALQCELAHSLNSPFIVGHAFFNYLDAHMNVVMHRLCHLCLSLQSHAEKEVIFSPGERAMRMYFVKSDAASGAVLDYTSVAGEKLDPPLQRGDSAAEAILWTEWRHQGELFSVTCNDVIAVDPIQFTEVMKVHPRPWFYAKAYAVMFLKFVNSMPSHEVSDIFRDESFDASAVASCDCCGSLPHAESDDADDGSLCRRGDGWKLERELDIPESQTMQGLMERWATWGTAGHDRGDGFGSARAGAFLPAAVHRCVVNACPCLGDLDDGQVGPTH